MFEREDWKLFRNIETLCQKAGVSKNKLKILVIKELVDNALDESSGCDIGLIDNKGFYVKDFGDGIHPDILEDLFSINRPMITSKLLRLPTRGALGNGLRVVAGYVISTGAKLFVTTRGSKYQIINSLDGVAKKELIESNLETNGTLIEIFLNDRDFISEADLAWGKNAILFKCGKEYTCKTSPYWYTSEAFFELANSYSGSILDLIMMFDGITKSKAASISSKLNKDFSKDLSFEESDALLTLLRANSKKINPSKLGFCGELQIGEYAKKTGEFCAYTAKGLHNAVIPYIVESWVQYGGKTVEILVNKTPITGNIHRWYKGGNLTIYGSGIVIDVKMKQSQVVVNLITPYMPITSDGKSPNFEEMNETILKTVKTANNKAKKLNILMNYNDSKNEKEVFFNYVKSAIKKASGDYKYKFSQRQLYYAIRPYIISALDKQPEYGYFCKLLTEYENYYGNIEGLYRDPRGTLYHPHLGQDIPIGTISVEEYERPKWTFNKIIYCEKEGFFPILKDVKFPERFDCALLSSKGYASRAVKDLFDLLGDTDEEILFFCIHDSDSAGTMIYETLQNETISRHGRRVKIINLGLDPWEALSMGLDVEEFESKGRKAVAPYIKERDYDYLEDWEEWLQSNRIELNAMTTPEFIDWLEYKISKYDNGKVIPTKDVLKNQLINETDNIIKDKIIKEILEKNNFEEKVKAAQLEAIEKLDNNPIKIDSIVEKDLTINRERHWSTSIKNLAKEFLDN